jgi:hypothetical protein
MTCRNAAIASARPRAEAMVAAARIGSDRMAVATR